MASSLEHCKEFWHDFGFVVLQKQLDDFAGEIATRQDEAESGRKKLIEMSKEFKKTASDETRKSASALLKSFQAEIDNLSKRSKAAESSFLTVYTKLSDAPDPSPFLVQATANKQKLSTLTDLEIEKKQLRETLEQYNLQFAQYKSQEIELDNLKKQLETFQGGMNKEVENQVSEMKQNITQDFAMKEEFLIKSNTELSQKLSEQTALMTKLQKSLEETESELFDVKMKFEEEMQNKTSEIELYLSDLEIANQKLNQSGHIIENFQQSTSQGNMDDELNNIKLKNRLYEGELKNKENEILRLVEETHNLQTEIARKDSDYRSKIYQNEQQISELTSKYEQALIDIDAQSDYTDIKAELLILKTVEFGEGEVDSEKSLELLLLNKNRSMQAENSTLRLEIHNCQSRLSALESDLHYSRAENEEQAVLVKQLEQDLTQLQAHRIREDADGEPTKAATVENLNQNLGEDTVDMLAIVTSQRERFKAKNQMLETDIQQLRSSYAVLQQDNAMLRSDNMKLYERIKFLQTMSSDVIGTDDDVTSKYSSQYEAHIDPFSAFNRREKHRKYVNLNSAERVVLNLGKMVLSDKVARHAVFFYSIVLHLMVFLVLYKFAVAEDCVQLSDCKEAYEAHMQQFHP